MAMVTVDELNGVEVVDGSYLSDKSCFIGAITEY